MNADRIPPIEAAIRRAELRCQEIQAEYSDARQEYIAARWEKDYDRERLIESDMAGLEDALALAQDELNDWWIALEEMSRFTHHNPFDF